MKSLMECVTPHPAGLAHDNRHDNPRRTPTPLNPLVTTRLAKTWISIILNQNHLWKNIQGMEYINSTEEKHYQNLIIEFNKYTDHKYNKEFNKSRQLTNHAYRVSNTLMDPYPYTIQHVQGIPYIKIEMRKIAGCLVLHPVATPLEYKA